MGTSGIAGVAGVFIWERRSGEPTRPERSAALNVTVPGEKPLPLFDKRTTT